ncbi:MAG: efflux transporter outer membrane subunit, partial [Polaromonas sp.]|nr:efflux transporter outer membrane subunit [Polaromonas sp.]
MNFKAIDYPIRALRCGHRATAALALLAALTAAGCSFIPNYERPAAPVADSYPAYAGAAASGPPNALATPATPAAPASSVPWQDFFGDPRLKQLIALALDSNRDLRVAVLNIQQARAQYGIRRADQFPTLSGVARGSRTPGPEGSVTSVYQAGLSVTAYEIDFFGRVASLKEAALNQYLATEEGRKTAQISLIAAVANGYLDLLATDELLDITRQTLATREESVRLSKLRFDSGVTSELDFRQAESLAEAARVASAQLQRRRRLDENVLTLLVGRPLGDQLPTAGAASTQLANWQPMANVPAGLPSELLALRPDIRRAEQLLLAANANIGAARAAFFPNISLTAGAGSASSQLSGLFKSGSWGYTLAPQLV